MFGDRCTLLRPQIIAGPHDPSGRFTYWLLRTLQDGAALAPGDGSDHLQVIDARDAAHFTKTVIENDLAGAFNLAGPRPTWTQFMTILGARNILWVSAEIIQSAGLTFMELPLYRPESGSLSGLMEVCNERARTAGLRLTELETTVADTRAWLRGRDFTPALARHREAELIAQARRAGKASPGQNHRS